MMIGTFEVNQLIRDDFGRAHGVLAIDKPVGLSSHDVVYEVRRALQTKAVGHAGALDPFASGLVFIIVGRATKLSDELMTMDKAYQADVLFGVGSDSQDTEGEIVSYKPQAVSASQIEAVLAELKGGYTQYVPVYSSVKINGQKLRVLARKYANFELFWRDEQKFVRFQDENKQALEIALPTHDVSFTSLTLDKLQSIKLTDLDQANEYNQGFIQRLTSAHPESTNQEYTLAQISTDCPKGTYIRQLAEDIGERLDPATPAMLTALRRTRIGQVTIDQSLTIDQLGSI